jgi:hypothetical protein
MSDSNQTGTMRITSDPNHQNRLGLVPAIGVYTVELDGSVSGKQVAHLPGINVGAWGPHNQFLAPVNGESFIGEWLIRDYSLGLTRGPDDLGPRSGLNVDYGSADVAGEPNRAMPGFEGVPKAKAWVALTPERIIGLFEGGLCEWDEPGTGSRIVAFAWDLNDVDRVSVTRPRKFGRLWADGELSIWCNEPRAWLHTQFVMSMSPEAKALRHEKSDMSGFARALGLAVERRRGQKLKIKVEEVNEGFWEGLLMDGKYREETLTFGD